MEIDIAGIDKAVLLSALHARSKALELGVLHDTGPMSVEECRDVIGPGPRFPYIDYLRGRVMKVDLNDDSFDSWNYDRDNGQGAAAAVVAVLRLPERPLSREGAAPDAVCGQQEKKAG